MVPKLQFLSAIFAFSAAVLWLWSARVSLPSQIRNIDFGSFDETVEKPADDMDRLTAGLVRQGRLSALAAVAAGVSAILQGIILSV